MNILITTPIFPPVIGGPATYVYELCQRLKDKHNITVISFGENLNNISGVEIIPIKIKYSVFGTFFRQGNLLRHIFKNIKNSDIVYAQGPDIVGLMSLIACKIFHKKLIIKFVGDLVWETAFGNFKTKKFLDDFLNSPNTGFFDKFKIWLQKVVYNGASKIIVPSEYLKSVLVKYYGIDGNKIEVIYNAIGLGKFQIPNSKFQINFKSQNSKTVKKSEFINIVTIGRLVNWKQIDKIIEAVRKLRITNYKLRIIGEGPEEDKLKDLVKKLGLENNVEFLGRLDHQESLEILSKADLFVLFSVYEGLPHTVIEAMLLKIPVIASDISGTNEIAINENTALLADKNSIEDLAKQISKIFEDDYLRNKLIENAFKLVNSKFNWEENIRALEKTMKI